MDLCKIIVEDYIVIKFKLWIDHLQVTATRSVSNRVRCSKMNNFVNWYENIFIKLANTNISRLDMSWEKALIAYYC